MPLPSETLSHSFNFLPKSSLKTLRLASREFYDIATPLLFDSIFVSARHVDRKIAEFVAARFPNSIQTLTFATEAYSSESWLEFEIELTSNPTRCKNSTLHVKKTKQFWELYCKVESEGKTLYDSGAVHAQLYHLLNTLPNLRQIVITDRRRRQDLSWLQEALLGVTVQAQAQLQTIQSGGCDCFDVIDKEPPFRYQGRYSSLAEAGTSWAPQNPWTVIMTALHKSPNASIHMISIQPKYEKKKLRTTALKDGNLDTLRATNDVLARLTKLELRLAHTSLEMGELPIKMLSGACRLRSLTIVMNDESATISPLYRFTGVPATTITTFKSFLAGCKLPHLSALHLHNVTFLENEFSTFLQHSPKLRELFLTAFYMVDGWHRWQPRFSDPRAWERLLQRVKETLPRLEKFDLSARQIYNGEHKYEDSRLLGSIVRTRDGSRDLDTLIQSFLFDEGSNPFADVAV